MATVTEMDSAGTPAHRLIARFGVATLARWTGRHRSRIHAWTWPISRGGTGGAVPPRARLSIIRGALAERGKTLAYAEFEPLPGEHYLMAEDAQ